MKLQGLHLHLDPVSGIAGDMAVAALVDAGVPFTVISRAVAALSVPGLRLRLESRLRGGMAAKGLVVTWRHHNHAPPPHAHSHSHSHSPHEHRNYRDIRRLLRHARLPRPARELALKIFARLAEVEAALHGVPVDRVAFHEVGAYDSIADIVGVAAAIAWLAPVSITSSPPVLGGGTANTSHGVVPVPAPATAELLRDIPVVTDGIGELTTPTGAAVLASIVDDFGLPPPMRIRAVGHGAGTREVADRPNVLRATLGEVIGRPDATPVGDVIVVETNLDDMSPQLVRPLGDALFAAGALDVWSTPIVMKKGRPALKMSAMAPAASLGAVERAFFRNSTALGLRRYPAQRTVLARSFATAPTRYGPARIKLASLDGEVMTAAPELDDCERLARAARVPVRDVVAEAAAAAEALRRGAGAPSASPRKPASRPAAKRGRA